MAFEYMTVDEARDRPGLRMVVVGNVPSPWGEAAKGILHIKGIDWAAVRLDYENGTTKQWTGQHNAPVVMHGDDKPRSGWADILLLAERMAPDPPLLPSDPTERALAFGLAHEICGEEGLSWSRRLQMIHAGLNGTGGFQEGVARYLAPKYGHSSALGEAAGDRTRALLRMLAARLGDQRDASSGFYVGSSLTAVDIYGATAMALFRPLPEEQCAMRTSTRAAFEMRDDETDAALDPILFEHRDRIYRNHLELPLSL